MITIKFGAPIGASKILIPAYHDLLTEGENVKKIGVLEGQFDSYIKEEGYTRIYSFLVRNQDYILYLNKNIQIMDNEHIKFISTLINSLQEYVIYIENVYTLNKFNLFIAKFYDIYEKALIVDSHNFFHKTYHAMQGAPLFSNSGVQTTLLKSLSNLLRWAVKQEYSHIVFASESSTNRRIDFTKEKYGEESNCVYKSKRDPHDIALLEQIKICNDFLFEIGMPICVVEGYEADDVMASLSKRFNEKDIPVHLFSSDKDLYQLYEYENVKSLDVKTRKVVPEEYWSKKFTAVSKKTEGKAGAIINPINFIDYQALNGDTADSIKGILGLGGVTVCILLEKYGNLKNICAAVMNGEDVGHKSVNKDSIKDAIIARDLVYLRRNLLNSCDLNIYSKKYYNFEDLLSQEFKKFDIVY